MNKLFIIGLPRTGTTSVSVALLDYGFKVAHTAYTKRAFELADVISDAPCFCDYPQLDKIFPDSKFVYLDRALEVWIPSIQMLLNKMLPELTPKGYLHPVLKRSMQQTFSLSLISDPLSNKHLSDCYAKHQKAVLDYFADKDNFLKIDVSKDTSLITLLEFLNIAPKGATCFPKLNVGKLVDNWKEFKHPNKVNSLSAGAEHRKFFDYETGETKQKIR
ncbi:sulfotransferase family protein [Cellvibrio zantedeschiae]|uniref:Sulfotransferase family protein n=1 Tax=Cellvibrio zantedeschiae TaxID=1237077 RepID=A0ABQ3B0E9_9GAMM|nr:sulfotransferase [Cellvibrio zantedeschiae]GGY72124.1 sulfotransferase family protein [Cellvibrio zantedeschiae]